MIYIYRLDKPASCNNSRSVYQNIKAVIYTSCVSGRTSLNGEGFMLTNIKWRISKDDLVARSVLLPTVLLTMIFVYAFIAFTIYISFTNSKILPTFDWVGMQNYIKLFKLDHWHTALKNMLIFSVLYIGLSTLFGLILAILIDLNKFSETFFRPV